MAGKRAAKSRPNKRASANGAGSLPGLLAKLAPHFKQMGRGKVDREHPFDSVVRASLVKALEFARFTFRRSSDPFFATATLRGICEDFIVLSFLKSHARREDVLIAICEDQLFRAITKQSDFFEANRKWQPTVSLADAVMDKARVERQALFSSLGWGKRLPTVLSMAEAGGHKELYEYLYAATSNWVHFTPGILLRLGWGTVDKGAAPTASTVYTFTTKHFRGYYAEFNRIYSVYLLSKHIDTFLSVFGGSAKAVAILSAQIAKELKAYLRWPEVVTFEEVNIRPPSPILLAVARAALEHDGPKKESGSHRANPTLNPPRKGRNKRQIGP